MSKNNSPRRTQRGTEKNAIDPEVKEFRNRFDASETDARDHNGPEPELDRKTLTTEFERMKLEAIDAGCLVQKLIEKLPLGPRRWALHDLNIEECSTKANEPKDSAAKNGNPTNGKSIKGVKKSIDEARTLLADSRSIETARVSPSPYQPRTVFDNEGLRELADSIKQVGLLQEIGVRKTTDGFELLYGERRLRAAKLLKWSMVPARILDVTDEEAVDIVLAENLKRKDLNPIDEARGYKIALEHGNAKTVDALAKRLGVSQPHISNRMRLLTLPQPILAAVEQGKLTPTHARELCGWATEEFAAAFLKLCEKIKWELPGVKDKWNWQHFLSDVFNWKDAFAVIDGEDMEAVAREHTEELHLLARPNHSHPKETHLFIPKEKFKIWKTLIAPLVEKEQARKDKQDAKRAAQHKAETKKLSPAERKAIARKLEAQSSKRVEAWYHHWLQTQIVARLDAEILKGAKRDAAWLEFSRGLLWRLALFFTVAKTHRVTVGEDGLDDAIKNVGVKLRPRSRSVFADLGQVTAEQLDDVALRAFRSWIVGPLDNWCQRHVDPDDLVAISREMAIDVGKEWSLDKGFLELFTKPQLFELASELRLIGAKFGIDHSQFHALKRSEAITQMLDQAKDRRLPTPAILLELAKGK